MIALTPLQQDALSEIFNIGMGRAANALSRLADDEIGLAVPTVMFNTRSAAAKILAESAGERVCHVRQRVEGQFSADAILIFPEANSLEILQLMVGDATLENLNEMEQEALSEIGNIILNACIGALTDLVGGDFVVSLPTANISTPADVLELGKRDHDETVMLIYIDFVFSNRQIYGQVAILLNVESMPVFMRKLEYFFASVQG